MLSDPTAILHKISQLHQQKLDISHEIDDLIDLLKQTGLSPGDPEPYPAQPPPSQSSSTTSPAPAPRASRKRRKKLRAGDRVRIIQDSPKKRPSYLGRTGVLLERYGTMFWNIRFDDHPTKIIHKMDSSLKMIP